MTTQSRGLMGKRDAEGNFVVEQVPSRFPELVKEANEMDMEQLVELESQLAARVEEQPDDMDMQEKLRIVQEAISAKESQVTIDSGF